MTYFAAPRADRADLFELKPAKLFQVRKGRVIRPGRNSRNRSALVRQCRSILGISLGRETRDAPFGVCRRPWLNARDAEFSSKWITEQCGAFVTDLGQPGNCT